MPTFEIFYIFDSRRMSNSDYIPRKDQQLPLAFGNLLKCGYNNRYMLYELKTETYYDVVTYVLFIENIDEYDLTEENIIYNIAPKLYTNFLDRLQCIKLGTVQIKNDYVRGFLREKFYEKMHYYHSPLEFTYPAYLHMKFQSKPFCINIDNTTLYKEYINLLYDVKSNDFFSAIASNDYAFSVKREELMNRARKIGFENENNNLKIIQNKSMEKLKKKNRKVFIFD